jgi:beta-1,4-mannosyltransferase
MESAWILQYEKVGDKMKRKNAFIFPSAGHTLKVSNPYVDDFAASLSEYFNFVNSFKPSKSGILNLYFYLGKIEIVFLNWIEDLPDRRAGLLQTLLLVILLYILKIKKIKVFYTLHNKESHYSSNRNLKKWLRKFLLNKADFILCHSTEGLNVLSNLKISGTARYFPHPFKTNISAAPVREKKYDILIWGSIRRYKGIDIYLDYLQSKNILHKYRIMIVGKIFPAEYENELYRFKSDSIQIENKFIDDDALNELIDQSKITLFTYQEKSVLSSGALIYSLSQGALVIGPHTGAFKDLYNEGLIDVFENYDDLMEKINLHLNDPTEYYERIQAFIARNTWNVFGSKVAEWIKKLS